MDPSLYEQVLVRNLDWLASTARGSFFQFAVRHLCQVLQIDGAMISDGPAVVAIWLSDGPALLEPVLSAGDDFFQGYGAHWSVPLLGGGRIWLMNRTPFERPEEVRLLAALYAPLLGRELTVRRAMLKEA